MGNKFRVCKKCIFFKRPSDIEPCLSCKNKSNYLREKK
jgi:hypothetical protein